VSTATEFYRWWIVDKVTGDRILTPYKLTIAHAALAFPGATPNVETREVRHLPNLGSEPWSTTRPGDAWVDTLPPQR
jgi:hypothetical protein